MPPVELTRVHQHGVNSTRFTSSTAKPSICNSPSSTSSSRTAGNRRSDLFRAMTVNLPRHDPNGQDFQITNH
jgi:hypothetical protein